jgi:hypothetical protein
VSEPATSDPADDPLAADKRTLVIALVAMVLLVSVGVVSAAVFTGSACQDISPSPVTTSPVASGEVTAGLRAAFPAAGDEQLAGFEAQLTGLAEQLGPVTGVAVADGADRLAITADGVAALGGVTTLLDARGAEVVARADVGAGVVVGDGDALVSLARVNDLTGQVDAFATVDATEAGALTEIGCVDTATVGTPLAFELDAADGQLLLFRAEEDGDDAELELRDPRDGRQWFHRVDVGVAPPGVTGERIDGRLGDRLAVLVRRTDPDEDVPLVTAVDRGDGTPRWELGREDLARVSVGATSTDPDAVPTGVGAVLREDAAQRLELLSLDEQQILIVISDARDESAVRPAGTDALGPSVGPGVVVALGAGDGAVRWAVPLEAGVRVLAGSRGDAGTWLVLADDERTQLIALDGDGQPLGTPSFAPLAEVVNSNPPVSDEEAGASDPSPGALVTTAAQLADGRLAAIAVLGDALVFVPSGDDQAVVASTEPNHDRLRARDIAVGDGRAHVLFAAPDGRDGSDVGARSVVVTFGGA